MGPAVGARAGLLGGRRREAGFSSAAPGAPEDSAWSAAEQGAPHELASLRPGEASAASRRAARGRGGRAIRWAAAGAAAAGALLVAGAVTGTSQRRAAAAAAAAELRPQGLQEVQGFRPGAGDAGQEVQGFSAGDAGQAAATPAPGPPPLAEAGATAGAAAAGDAGATAAASAAGAAPGAAAAEEPAYAPAVGAPAAAADLDGLDDRAAAAATAAAGAASATEEPAYAQAVAGAPAAAAAAAGPTADETDALTPYGAGGAPGPLAPASEEEDSCSDTYALSDFSSRTVMEQAGWYFGNWSDDSFKPVVALQGSLLIDQYVPAGSYWGFSMTGSGKLTTVLRGSGTVTIDFGNPSSTPGSAVEVFVGHQAVAQAAPYTLSHVVDAPFHHNDWLEVTQGGGIILINSVIINCDGHDAGTSVAPAEDKADPCECKAIWTYAGQSYGGCTQTEDSGAASWCYVEGGPQGGPGCEKAVQSSVDGEQQLYWRSCLDPCECLENWEYTPPGSSEKASYSRCAMPVDAKAPWCYVLGSEECGTAQRSNQTQSMYWRLCNMSAASVPSEQVVERAKSEWKHAFAENQKDDLAAKRKQDQYNRLSNLSKAVNNKSTEKDNETNASVREDKEALKKAADSQQKQSKEDLKKARAKANKSAHDEAAAAAKVEELLSNRSKSEKLLKHDRGKSLKLETGKKVGTTTTAKPEAPPGPSLYCFALMMPFGYEPELMKAQMDKGVGIFACEEWAVFTNESELMDTDNKSMPFDVHKLDFSLEVPFGGKWYTALNADIFNKIWGEVVSLGDFDNHDWVIKADPDCVFFPDRLRYMLRKHVHQPKARALRDGRSRRLRAPRRGLARNQTLDDEDDDLEDTQQIDGEEEGFEANCGMCKLPGFEDTSCGSHISWWQTQGKSCTEAVVMTARQPPEDCACTECLETEACDLSLNPDLIEDGKVSKGTAKVGAMYINNCKFGLHGPVEVLSAAAVSEYVTNLDQCKGLTAHAWGEDKFLDRCMLQLGVTRVNRFELLSEVACAENPVPCGGSDIAFHPFKTKKSYFACWHSANMSSGQRH